MAILPTVRVHGERGPVTINKRDYDPSRHLLYVEGETKEQAFQRVVEQVEAAEKAAAEELFLQVESEERAPVAVPGAPAEEEVDRAEG